VLDATFATNLFIDAALVATSVGITAAVLIELDALDRRASRTILGAAIIDDILAMVLLAVAAGIAPEGGVDIASIVAVVAQTLRSSLRRPRRHSPPGRPAPGCRTRRASPGRRCCRP
jgi:Kef-type K+ transport system membrane component KefB